MKSFSTHSFSSRLLAWFDQHGRGDLPWQKNKTPYRVWVSEIMLQQTQVATVIPYFEKFMRYFPDVNALSRAHLDEVLTLWAGLGYYSRARNLHRAALMVTNDYHGVFPDNLTDLKKLPGIGPSTAGAILSIAYQTRATILDGNVKRVLARVFGVRTPINEKPTEKILWELAERYTPQKRVGDYTQAIMDLGATCCTRTKPRCEHCPFQKHCIAHLEKLTHQLPAKKVSKKIPTRVATFLMIEHQASVLLQKRKASGIWGGLWSLPEIPGEPEASVIEAYGLSKFGKSFKKMERLTPFRHTFTHYHLHIHPVRITVSHKDYVTSENEIWYNPLASSPIGLPKPVQQLLENRDESSRSMLKAQQASRRLRQSTPARAAR